MRKKHNNLKKKIIFFTLSLTVLILISSIITVQKLNTSMKKEINQQTGNIFIYNEAKNEIEQDEDDVMVVALTDEPMDTDPQNNENSKNTDNDKKNVEIPYYIKVNYEANVVTVYKKDKSGKYEIPIKAMICSCGEYTPPCPKYPDTVYTMPDGKNTKFVWGKMEGDVYAQYATRIVGGILFHSVPYTEKNKSSLEWWEYDKLGTTASLGCVRLSVQDAKWIYDNCIGGTQVEFYSSTNPGPLGKPIAKKISKDEEVRGWDPTDPDKNNPWSVYLKKKEEEVAIAKVAEEQAKAQEASIKPVENTNTMNNTNTTNTNTNVNTNTNTNTSADTNTNNNNTSANEENSNSTNSAITSKNEV